MGCNVYSSKYATYMRCPCVQWILPLTVTDNVTKRGEGAPDQHWTLVPTACPLTPRSTLTQSLKSLPRKTLTMLNMYVSDRSWWTSLYYSKRGMGVICLLCSSHQSKATCTQLQIHMHTHACTHTQNNQKWHICYNICKTSQNVQDMHQ